MAVRKIAWRVARWGWQRELHMHAHCSCASVYIEFLQMLPMLGQNWRMSATWDSCLAAIDSISSAPVSPPTRYIFTR